MSFTKIGVVGAGTMGCGIAQKIAQENISVVMVDVKQEFVEKGLNNIKTLLDEGVQKKVFTAERAQQTLSNIKGTINLDDVKDADFVIEAIFEDKKVKTSLFQSLDKICLPKTIFASNTSSFKVSELAQETSRAARFIGLHYFYHPAKNRLLEIIPISSTTAETLERADDFATRTGKTAILVKDSPGFAVNRFFVPWLNESARILEEGIANTATIDEAAKRTFGIGMGPFLLMNVTGIPIAYHSTETLGKELGSFYATTKRLREQFESKNKWDLSGSIDESKIEIIGNRLLSVIFLVAGQLVDESVASIEDVDRGAKIGLLWTLGPFELMNKIGMDKSQNMVKNICKKYNLPVPAVLVSQSNKPWLFSMVDLNIRDNIATITINRPEALNALNEDVINQLDSAFQKAEADKNVKMIVIEGKGKAFVAGADIGFFIKKIETNKLNEIVEFTINGQDLLRRIDKSPKLVVAKLDGIALGGGAELALACDIILMTERAGIGFPETGIGIYPGLGGTQRLPRLIGKSLAKYLVFTGEVINAKMANEFGLAESVSVANINNYIKELSITPDPKARLLKTIISSARTEKIKSMFNDDKIDDLLSGKLLNSKDEFEVQIAKKVSYKAPIALRLSDKIIDEGTTLSLEEGLKRELISLTEIFSTRDAYEGLTSIIQKRRPVYKGH
ncbi:MAG: 3-hydroxyacyl-CoA dehydrogenase NAD-binding domain-containing protein [Planctomycetota bacterium]|nr:3-hydroxyacyl-CoA dehydrogenase NAD-binding domain-containing protein [Planctomycetota bacterium]MDI6787057.1 3-hydroxyacyl-CoA dehydrogenase NAD-binding domain-containing protein [Planctomycetota bacterium]